MGVIARDLAVEIVDMVHGFTVEFSNQPSAHLAEYDMAEKIIGRALADLHQGAMGAVSEGPDSDQAPCHRGGGL